MKKLINAVDDIVPESLAGLQAAHPNHVKIDTSQNLVLRAATKPYATLMSPLQSVNIQSKEKEPATVERSDVTAVPACGVAGEAMVAFELAASLLEKFGGDSLKETKEGQSVHVTTRRRNRFPAIRRSRQGPGDRCQSRRRPHVAVLASRDHHADCQSFGRRIQEES